MCCCVFIIMKKFFIAIFLSFFSCIIWGQVNLVPNPSFEIHTSCPAITNQLFRATSWYNPTGNTPDYFNVCGYDSVPGNSPGVPNNFWGYQTPRTGNAYADVSTNGTGDEYVAVRLDSALKSNTQYCVEFYLSLGSYSKYTTSAMGAYFSNSMLTDYSIITNLPVTPQIINPVARLLTDTTDWMLVSGKFIATGGEQYMTIGNFFDQPNTVMALTYPSNIDNNVVYYIDDVSVIECPEIPPTPEVPLSIPSAICGNNVFEIKELTGMTELRLFNSLGQIVYSTSDYQNNLNTIEFTAGIYYYYVKLSNGDVYKGKLCIVH